MLGEFVASLPEDTARFKIYNESEELVPFDFYTEIASDLDIYIADEEVEG